MPKLICHGAFDSCFEVALAVSAFEQQKFRCLECADCTDQAASKLILYLPRRRKMGRIFDYAGITSCLNCKIKEHLTYLNSCWYRNDDVRWDDYADDWRDDEYYTLLVIASYHVHEGGRHPGLVDGEPDLMYNSR